MNAYSKDLPLQGIPLDPQALAQTQRRLMGSVGVRKIPGRPTVKGEALKGWLRVHRRMGTQVLRVAPRSMLVTGTISEWESWTDMRFPESGEYVVPGALQPVVMDVERDTGTYEEPNVWMRHVVDC